MRFIQKNSEPASFTHWKQQANADWQPSFDDLRKPYCAAITYPTAATTTVKVCSSRVSAAWLHLYNRLSKPRSGNIKNPLSKMKQAFMGDHTFLRSFKLVTP
jgi:hypothetical protein